MSGRGRRASAPEGGHLRPAVREREGLVITHVQEAGGRSRTYDFAELPCARGLAEDLAGLFADQLGPAGPWRSLPTSGEVWRVLATFTRFLASQEPAPGRLSELTAGHWAAWRLSRGQRPVDRKNLAKSAMLLAGSPDLPDATRAALVRRSPRETNVKEAAYSAEEFDRIKTVTAAMFRRALLRIRQNVAHLQRWRAGELVEGTDEWLVGSLLEHIERTGNVPTYPNPAGRWQIRRPIAKAMGGTGPVSTWARLFLMPDEAAALQILLIATYGWNATSVAELEAPRPTPASAPGAPLVWHVELVKRRRGAAHGYESRNLPDWGAASPGRLIAEAVEATAPARAARAAVGAPSTRLLVWHTSSVRSAPAGIVEAISATTLINGHATATRPDSPLARLKVNQRRLRKTVVLANQPGLIQHSRDVRDSVYLLPDLRTQHGAQEGIEAGITSAMAAAKDTFAARTSRADGDLAADTATATCEDFNHSPFSEHGIGCRASFLLCLGCPNAVVTPRHLPRLAHLSRVLEGCGRCFRSRSGPPTGSPTGNAWRP